MAFLDQGHVLRVAEDFVLDAVVGRYVDRAVLNIELLVAAPLLKQYERLVEALDEADELDPLFQNFDGPDRIFGVAQDARLEVRLGNDPLLEGNALRLALHAELIMRRTALDGIAEECEVSRAESGVVEVGVRHDAVAGNALQSRIKPLRPPDIGSGGGS